MKNSILNYITRSPASAVGNSPARFASPSSSSKNAPSVHSNKKATPMKAKKDIGKKNKKENYNTGDLVWGLLEGYPWWPGIVCPGPSSKDHFNKKRKELHVQFFDQPPNRAWLKLQKVQRFTNSLDGPSSSCEDEKFKKVCEEADKAAKMTLGERVKLLVEFPPSDEEMEAEDDLGEDGDGDNGGDSDKSKENVDTNSRVKRRRERDVNFTLKAKRQRILELDGDDSEDEYKPAQEESDSEDSASSGVPEDEVSDVEEFSEEDSPVKKKASKRKLTTPSSKKAVKQMTLAPLSSGKKNSVSSSPSVRDNTKIRLSMFSAEDEPACDVGSQQEKQWTHLSMDFLREDKIMDAQKRRPNDPEYDPKTLYLPEDLKGKLTPAHRQWWDIKSKNFDVVLFFKVGKFYELFHMDAVIGVKELNLLFMKGDYAHSGFPEISYAKYSQTLIQKGYKVARIEQTETPEMADARCKKMSRSSKFDKVVNRELCRITTRGTMTCGVLEGDIGDSRARYLLAIAEQKIGSQSSSLGVCFVDTTIGSFHLGQFEDDKHFSRLRTLMAHHSPVQILYEKGRISGSLKGVICMVPVERDGLAPESEFWNADKTLNFLSENAYFDEQEEDWPQELLNLSTGDKRTVRGDRELAIRALGAVIWYLNRCLIDQELVSLRQFHWYEPIQEFSQQSVSPNQTDSYMKSQRNMVLDEITLKNLEVVVNSSGTEEGTLLQQLDRCVTPFGKRLLRQWVCNPLCRPKGINSRLDAIEDILAHKDAIETVIGLLRQLPDLQRLLSRIHTQGHGKRSQDHPDSRAILFEAQIYSKRKITDFISALNGFKVAAEIQDLMHKLVGDSQSELLKQILTLERDGGRFPDLIPQLQFFEGAFDKKQALKDGCITPANGVDREYDMALRNLQEVESQFQGYLKEQSQFFGCKVVYYGTGRNRYQLEVASGAARKAGSDYELQSQRKGYQRFYTSTTKELYSRQVNAEEQRDAAIKDITRRVFAQFDKHFRQWDGAVQCLSVLDVLFALAEFSRSFEGVMCRPKVLALTPDQPVVLDIKGGRHPCLSGNLLASSGNFVPNPTHLGGEEPTLLLLTGPNMGGKSTLMRQAGLIVILAQLGSFVPAETCTLTTQDRIFTRLGASDSIMTGESTFFVELSETAAILQHASPYSFVLLDELGRGTATFDGTSIAHAVVKKLADLKCLTIFSTHYFSLVEDFESHPSVSLGHMACMVEDANEEDPTEETIAFLYQLSSRACPKSYGFNAARLAGLPLPIIRKAHSVAKNFEATLAGRNFFQSICLNSQKAKELRKVLTAAI